MLASPNLYLRRVFTDSDDLAETVHSWNVEFSRMDRGAFRGVLEQYVASDFLLSRASSSARLRQRGQAPVGMRTFVLSLNPAMEMTWRGHRVGGADLLLFPQSGELEAATAPGFDVLTVSMGPGILEQACWETVGMSSGDLLRGEEVYPLPPPLMSDMRRRFHRRMQQLSASGTLGPADTWGMICRMVETISWKQNVPIRTTHAMRKSIVAKAEGYAHAHAAEAPTVADLCLHTGASERTLQYAFRNCLGVPPKAYILAMRLNGVRRALKSASKERPKIADVANAWGFWHMGQFAADYRKMFGELPSETRQG